MAQAPNAEPGAVEAPPCRPGRGAVDPDAADSDGSRVLYGGVARCP